ncbi:MAG: enoyl-CoA hydratase/isomerase family protein [Desulfovibrio sp.]|nr:enoyl-CoA hydratase/isomerase family protein [Desulfovibrio sp.]MBI4959332.1 enoyl-CoA hydratase/isomerase family protein [Desulfovibrio sp.]
MNPQGNLSTDNEIFSSSLEDNILVIRQKRHLIHVTHDINKLFSFYEYLESMLVSKDIKALIVFGAPDTDGFVEFGKTMCKAVQLSHNNKLFDRFLNAVNRLFISLSTMNCLTIYAVKGLTSLFHLNLSLAYDYRIVSDNSSFENTNADIGIITKGSGYFLPRLLGVKKATEVLQWKSFSAEDALQLGLIDRIVPETKLEDETLQFARTSLEHPISAMLGVRKLLKCDQQELKRSLDLEDKLIKDRLESPEFKHVLEKYCQQKFGCSSEEMLSAS